MKNEEVDGAIQQTTYFLLYVDFHCSFFVHFTTFVYNIWLAEPLMTLNSASVGIPQ